MVEKLHISDDVCSLNGEFNTDALELHHEWAAGPHGSDYSFVKLLIYSILNNRNTKTNLIMPVW